MLLVTAASGRPRRPALTAAADFPLVAEVELVPATGAGRRVAFGTGSDKSLEAFKDALWAVDGDAGVRYRVR